MSESLSYYDFIKKLKSYRIPGSSSAPLEELIAAFETYGKSPKYYESQAEEISPAETALKQFLKNTANSDLSDLCSSVEVLVYSYLDAIAQKINSPSQEAIKHEKTGLYWLAKRHHGEILLYFSQGRMLELINRKGICWAFSRYVNAQLTVETKKAAFLKSIQNRQTVRQMLLASKYYALDPFLSIFLASEIFDLQDQTIYSEKQFYNKHLTIKKSYFLNPHTLYSAVDDLTKNLSNNIDTSLRLVNQDGGHDISLLKISDTEFYLTDANIGCLIFKNIKDLNDFLKEYLGSQCFYFKYYKLVMREYHENKITSNYHFFVVLENFFQYVMDVIKYLTQKISSKNPFSNSLEPILQQENENAEQFLTLKGYRKIILNTLMGAGLGEPLIEEILYQAKNYQIICFSPDKRTCIENLKLAEDVTKQIISAIQSYNNIFLKSANANKVQEFKDYVNHIKKHGRKFNTAPLNCLEPSPQVLSKNGFFSANTPSKSTAAVSPEKLITALLDTRKVILKGLQALLEQDKYFEIYKAVKTFQSVNFENIPNLNRKNPHQDLQNPYIQNLASVLDAYNACIKTVGKNEESLPYLTRRQHAIKTIC